MIPQVSFRTRVVLLMIITTLLVVSLAGFAVERLAGQAVMAESEQHAQQIAATAAATIEGHFIHIAAFPKTLGALAATLGETAETRLAWYHTTIPAMFAAAPPEVLSLTTFFEPGFIQGQQYAKVWYVRNNSGRIQEVTTNMPGEANYDTEQPLYDYFPQEWYTAPLKAAGLVWSEPYFDAGGANVSMVTANWAG